MNQMTIFEAIENKPDKKIGLLHRWHIVKPYDDIADFVATAIPGKDTVSILPGKHQDIIAYKKFDLSYEQYQEWLKENGYEERDVK